MPPLLGGGGRNVRTEENSMKRSEINAALKEMEGMIRDYRIALPPFCYFTPEEWQQKGHEFDEVRDNMLGWDITDYGLGRFDEVGFSLITLRNGNLKKKIDDNLMAQNQGAKKIGQLFKEGKRDEAEAIKAEMAALKETERVDRAKLQEQEELLQSKMVLLPNLPNAAVAPGKGAEDNEIVYTQGDASNLPEGALPHWELVKKYDIID